MTVRAGVRVERAATTRAALIKAARELFSERGYHATGTPEVVALAGVTRGALYHHFRDKEALFEAVFHELGAELEAEAAGAVVDVEDRWLQLQQGVQAFLEVVARRSDIQRVVLLDGPAVFGWVRWREMESTYTLDHLVIAFEALVDAKVIRDQPLVPLAHLVMAALNEAALLISNSDDPQATHLEVAEALRTLVSGLR